MEFQKLKPKSIFGLNYNVKNNIDFLDDNIVIYVAGSVVVIRNSVSNEQQYLKITNQHNVISILCVSQNRDLFGVCEAGETPCISLYHNVTYKKKAVITIPTQLGNEADSKNFIANPEIISIAFTYDNSHLIVVIGKPYWYMFCFDLDTDKLRNVTKLNNVGPEATIVQVACNPGDQGLLVVVGKYIFRILANNEAIWHQYGYNKAFANLINFTCVSWLSQNRILAGTDDSRIFLMESGELRFVYDANMMSKLNFKAKEGYQKVSINMTRNINSDIRLIVTFPRGFVFSLGFGTVHLFKKVSNTLYEKRNLFKVPDISDIVTDTINSIAVSPTLTQLLVTCGRPQIYSIQLWQETFEDYGDIFFDEIGPKVHDSPISDLSCCLWKPIFMTCGEKDQTVRIWNYETESVELIVHFQQKVISLALHPTGLFLLIAFVEKLKFMAINYDSLSTIREFQIANCRNCSFSYHGTYFTFSHKKDIFVYSSVQLIKVFELKAHSGEVQSLTWTGSDHILISCGSDGVIYEWDLKTGERIGETIIKHNQLCGATNSLNGRDIFAITLDGYLKVIVSSTVIKSYEVSKKKLNNITLSNSNNVLIMSEMDGSVITVKLPIRKDELERKAYYFHGSAIRKIAVTPDCKYLISCSNDGNIIIWDIVFKGGSTSIMADDVVLFAPFYNDILVSKSEYVHKLKNIQDLNNRIEELKHEHEYHLRELKASHFNDMSDIDDKFQNIINEKNVAIQKLDELYENDTSSLKTTIENLHESHAQAVQRMETNLHDKLIVEYDKYNDLLETKKSMRLIYLKEIDDIKNAAKSNENSLKIEFNRKLDDSYQQIENQDVLKLKIDAKKQIELHNVYVEQMIDDTDREIDDLKETCRKQTGELEENNAHLRGEISLVQKKLAHSQKQFDDLKTSIKSYETEIQKSKKFLKKYENDVNELRKEIAERDDLIQMKEQRVRDLTIGHEELEKIRAVHDYKIKELNDKLEPKDRQIQEQKDQIRDILDELLNLDKTIADLHLQMSHNNEKLATAKDEFRKEELKCRQLRNTLKSLELDLINSKNFIQDPLKLVNILKEIYSKYVSDDQLNSEKIESIEIRNELKRYRMFLENTIDKLKKSLTKNNIIHQNEKKKLIRENLELINNINSK